MISTDAIYDICISINNEHECYDDCGEYCDLCFMKRLRTTTFNINKIFELLLE